MEFPETFLSPAVRYLLVDSRHDTTTISDTQLFVNRTNLTFNWTCIAPHLSEVMSYTEEKVLRGTVYADTQEGNQADDVPSMFMKSSLKMWPTLREAGIAVQACEKPPTHLWKWTHCEQELLKCYEELKADHSNVTPLKATLLLSSVLERALGNVYLTKGKCVPFLLRDLLATEELLHMFGPVAMSMACALAGTPFAFNVRNVCWHGFPSPNEIHSDIAASLLVLIGSLGQDLLQMHLNTLPRRLQITASNWEPFILSLQSASFPSLEEKITDVKKAFDASSLIPTTHKLYWSMAVEMFSCGHYGESLLLLVPALEHLLRCLFCKVNACFGRLLLAEQNMLYSTMDVILARKFHDNDNIEQENALQAVLGEKILEMILDLFDCHAGPRLRDKLSHGECELCDIPGEIVNHVLYISLLILNKVEDSHVMCTKTEFELAEKRYVAQFQPVALLISKSLSVVQNLEKLIHCPRAVEFDCSFVCAEVVNFKSAVEHHSSILLNFSDGDIGNRINNCLKAEVSTLYRPKSELELIAVLLKILSKADETCSNCCSAFSERYKLYNEHRLRSRQRNTYASMIRFLPSLHTTLQCAVLVVLLQLLTSQYSMPLLTSQYSVRRFLHQLLKYTENLSSYSSPQKNRWTEIKNLTHSFCLYACNALLNDVQPTLIT